MTPASLTLEQILTPVALTELQWLLLRLGPEQDIAEGLRGWLGSAIHESFVEAVLGSVGIHEIHDSTGSHRASQVIDEAGRWDDSWAPEPVPTDERPVAPAKSQDQPTPAVAPAESKIQAVPPVAPSVLAESSIQRKAEEEEAWRLKQEEDAALTAAAEDSSSFFEEEPEEEPTPKKPKCLSPAEQAVAYREAVQAVIEEHDILPDTAYASSRIAKWAWTEQGVQISSADVGTVLRSLGWQLRAGPGATAYYSPGKARQ